MISELLIIDKLEEKYDQEIEQYSLMYRTNRDYESENKECKDGNIR